MRRSWAFGLVVAASFGCGDSGHSSGEFDAGFDAGARDASFDAAQSIDAAIEDAAEPFDAQSSWDASLPDASARDAQALDAMVADAHAGDADGALPDEAGSDAGAPAYPALLSQTGLFTDIANDVIASDVRAYEPKYKLWSDGAEKRRWLYLPPGETIDTSNMDRWVYPVGTKVFKEFSSAGVRVETRMLHKVAADTWLTIAYQWRADLSDAEAVPDGVENANGTQHDIPSVAQCLRCHGNMRDRLLGVSAIQLSHQLGGVSLQTMIDEHRLSDPPSALFQIPGGSVAEQALGYLHANCGHCHNPQSAVYADIKTRGPHTGGPRFWENVAQLGSVEETEGYASTVGQPNSVLPDLHIIEPGEPALSELYVRIGQRGAGSLQMPPIATEIVDPTGMAAIRAWIEALAPDAGAVHPDSGAPDGG